MKYFAWIWRNTRGIRLNTLVRILAGIGQVGLGLLMVWLCREFIDNTVMHGTTDDIVKMVIYLVATVLAGITLRQLYYYMSISAGVRQTNDIRLRIFSHLFRRRMYEGSLHSGDITSRLEKDVSVVSDVCTSLLPQFTITLVQLIGAFLLMHSMDTTLAWILLLLTPILVAMGKFITRQLREMTRDIREQDASIQMLVQEGMEHNVVLRSLESNTWITGRLDDMQQDLKGKVKRRTRFTLITRALLSGCFGMGYLLAFVWGGLQLRDGLITFGVMTSFLQLVGQIQHPIMGLLNMVPQMIHASASIDRLVELEKMNVEETSGKKNRMEGMLGVSMKDVSFQYTTGDNYVVNHFSHDFLPGTKTALTGETGAGKTTLFRLLLALATPKSGSITLYSTRQASTQSHYPVSPDTRCNFVFVPQGNTLMSGSIRYNLLLAKPEATDDELKKVLHTAVADFVNELPQGLDTECGERGAGLSEGQAQRIAIARGLLRPGNILLLDEISSSLDEQTERTLFSRLFKDYPNKTMIMISHRPSISQLCDEIIKIKG
ncbi:MAG: ABC transporter ATP-binding protein [Prevotella sp.]|nr:ABC transporter ATP-binding protein [Prevotella sp.]